MGFYLLGRGRHERLPNSTIPRRNLCSRTPYFHSTTIAEMAPTKRLLQVSQSKGQAPTTLPVEVLLRSIYTAETAGSSGAFRGAAALQKRARELGYHITLKDCRRFLASLPSYTENRPARQRYPRNKIQAHFCGHVVQIDIMDMQKVAEENDDYRYVLVAYDTFSKYLWTLPLPNRKPDSIMDGLETLLKDLPFAITTIYWDKVCCMCFFSFVSF